jgi:hypothetical protein
MNDATPEAWSEWLRSFRARFIAAQGWSEKEAKRRIRDAWAVVRDGRVHVLASADQRPADAVPVFEILTPGGWMRPIEITDRLTGLVGQAMSSDRSPRDIVLGLLSQVEHADGQHESHEIQQKRSKAAFWAWQLLDACEDEALGRVVDSDAFWRAVLYALQAGRRFTILERYRDPQVLADLIKAQAFARGRGPDELSRHLEASRLERRAVLGRNPAPQEVFEAAGGVESKIDECWDFEGLETMPSIPTGALYDRLDKIRRRHS